MTTRSFSSIQELHLFIEQSLSDGFKKDLSVSNFEKYFYKHKVHKGFSMVVDLVELSATVTDKKGQVLTDKFSPSFVAR